MQVRVDSGWGQGQAGVWPGLPVSSEAGTLSPIEAGQPAANSYLAGHHRSPDAPLVRVSVSSIMRTAAARTGLSGMIGIQRSSSFQNRLRGRRVASSRRGSAM